MLDIRQDRFLVSNKPLELLQVQLAIVEYKCEKDLQMELRGLSDSRTLGCMHFCIRNHFVGCLHMWKARTFKGSCTAKENFPKELFKFEYFVTASNRELGSGVRIS